MTREEGERELAQMQALKIELAINKAARETLEWALQGIGSCATQCPCCEMHRQVANRALGYDVAITTDRIDPMGKAAPPCTKTLGCWLPLGHEGHCD